MRSLYKRQFALTAGMILISFALLGTAFFTLSYQYTLRQTRDSMERNANYVANFTSKSRSLGLGVEDDVYIAMIATIAQISDAVVLITEADGEMVVSTDGISVMGYKELAGSYLPKSIADQVARSGSYTGMSDLGGFFAEKRYVAGTPILVKTVDVTTGQTRQSLVGVAYVAAEASSLTELWRAFTSIFFFTAVVVLCIAFLTSSVTSLRQTKPLKEIAETARKFGHGEYELRVRGYEDRKDEVGELAEAFNAMADSISKSEERRSEFVANISHELKTPMTTIAGFSDGILDGTIPPDRERAALQTISSETRRLSRLVRRMLDLSRLQSAENVTAQEQFDVSEVMLRVLVSLETKINSRRLDVDTQLPDAPVMVWGDPDAITQVCYNLLDNAIKFSAEGSTMGISITTKGGKAHVAVRNTGATIPPDELAMIFDRFHKSDKSRSVDREGVGLGLYIVKTILNNHKENITVTSQDGVTEFVFTLTLA
ncbi:MULTISPECIES: sensor histidine kinase [Oscillospiraceae]|uniref:sensor histidine kinase n=1 Tax=Oscillospiraceae TaxID=216572 RepID=UPI000B383389|nr:MULTISPECIES: HAMP domain-containing sensor histidine kinase [Oscillospiraceae]MBM6723734.1 HAMP domain-containing histidine kinase [Pseudoflavonifractor phocaeensis]MBM6885917.1 HAMP domain-containing histidine kinase [Pseudoflavonifractor phocaeensis]OUO38262.1 two-component sensor histidine kinase [Flavonifractor sp. An306]